MKIYQFMGYTKALLKGKPIRLNEYIRKEGKSPVKKLSHGKRRAK